MKMLQQFHRMKEWFDQHANPIALLETRQVLSLTRTILLYGFLVLGLVSVSHVVIAEQAKELPMFLLGAYAFVCVLVVPSQILFNSSARWSQDKLEMLHLTQLRPIDIVFGRLMSGAALLMILGSVILPFVSLAYLIPGTDITLVLLGMTLTFLFGLMVILVTLNVSWRLEQYSFSSLGKGIWFFMLLQASFGIVGLNIVLIEEVSTSDLDKLLAVLPWLFGGWLLVGYFGVVNAITLFRHVESNRSTPYRLGAVALCTFIVVIAVTFLPSKEIVSVILSTMHIFALFSLSLMTESDRIGRNVFVKLYKRRWQRILAFPFMPSAGSAMVFLMLGLLVQVGLVLIQDYTLTYGGLLPIYTALQLFAVVSLIVPRFRDSKWTSTTAKRNAFVALYLPLLSFPFLLLAFLSTSDVPIRILFTYVFPFEIVFRIFGAGILGDGIVLWSFALTLLSIVLNYRMVLSSWNVLVDLKHPSLERIVEPSSKREHDEAS